MFLCHLEHMVSKVPHRRERETEKHRSSQMPYTRPCTTSTNIPFARTQSLGPHLTVRMLEKAIFCVPRKSSVLRAQPHVGHPYFGELSGQPAAFSMEHFSVSSLSTRMCMVGCRSLFARVPWKPQVART